MRLGSRVLVPLILLTVGLTACAGPAGAPTGSPTTAPSSAAPSETPTPSETPAAVEAVVVDATGLTIVDADGDALHASAWVDDVAATADALDEAFGVPAVRTDSPGDGSHTGPGMTYEWDGMTIESHAVTANDRYPNGVWVFTRIDAADVGGVAIRTTSGVQVGMTEADAATHGAGPSAAHPFVSDAIELTTPPIPLFVDLTLEQGAIVEMRTPATDNEL